MNKTSRERAIHWVQRLSGGDVFGHQIEQLAADFDAVRREALEEAAKVAELMEWADNESNGTGFPIADKIRALLEEPK